MTVPVKITVVQRIALLVPHTLYPTLSNKKGPLTERKAELKPGRVFSLPLPLRACVRVRRLCVHVCTHVGLFYYENLIIWGSFLHFNKYFLSSCVT